MTAPLFHPGELRAQLLAHVDGVRAGIYPAMPAQHREFYAALRYLFVATVDAHGWPLATLFSGPAGFLRTPDDRHLRISAPRRDDDPAQAALHPGQPVGALGLDFSNRRRNRVNGTLSRMDKNRLEIEVHQCFGNCPQYIQRRQLIAQQNAPQAIEYLPELDDAARRLIRQADTCFVASYAHLDLAQGGVDISHRGGLPGFIHLEQQSLWIPDFRGNRYMNTLGNLLAEPRAALLLPDFANGDLLHLQGVTQIVWQSQPLPNIPAAERYWRFELQRAWRFADALPWRGGEVEYAPTTLQTRAGR